MPAAATATASVAQVPKPAKPQHVPDKKYKCQFCARAFSRSEHRSRHERSRKFFRTLPFPLVNGGVAPWWGHEAHLLPTLANIILVPRHQRATFQMRKVPQYLCPTRPFAPTRSNCTRQRWRGTARQRSQETARRKANGQNHSYKAARRLGYGDDGTNRSKQ